MNSILSACIIFICTLQFKYSNSIVIEHVGEINKPIPTIKITDEKSDTLNEISPLYYRSIVEPKTYKSIYHIVSNTTGNPKTDRNDFGTFKLSLYNKGMLRQSYFLDRKKTLLLLDQLIRDLKQKNDSEQLRSYLLTNKKRINY